MLGGGTSYRDDYQMLGYLGSKVFDRLAQELGVERFGIIEPKNYEMNFSS